MCHLFSQKSVSSGNHNMTIRVANSTATIPFTSRQPITGRPSVPVVIISHGGAGTESRGHPQPVGVRKRTRPDSSLSFLTPFRPTHQTKPLSAETLNCGTTAPTDSSPAKKPRTMSASSAQRSMNLIASVCCEQDADLRLTDFSNGASMSFRIGAELSKRIAAIAPVAGASWLAVCPTL